MAKYSLVPVAVEIQLYAALLLKYFSQALDERLRQRGERISSLQHGILRMVQFETLTISEISQRMGMDPSSLVRAVDALEAKGLAGRGSDHRDRRRHPITITEKGTGLLAAVPAIADEDPVMQVLQSLGPESSTQLRDQLRTLMIEFPEGRAVAEIAVRRKDRL